MRHRSIDWLRCGLPLLLGGLTLGVFQGRAALVINEIHYNPDVKTEPAEFVEIWNTGPDLVDLRGWAFDDGIEFTFPSGAAIPPGQGVIVAQDPVFLKKKYGADAIGPFSGSLSKSGERIRLRDAAGNVADEVTYGAGFPWPTVGDPPGYSIELINPALDNDLAGNWRASVVGGVTQPASKTLIEVGSSWRFRKGTAEASTPSTAWRDPAFDDAGWSSGSMPIGYDPAVSFGTRLDDMRGSYTSIFLRRTFAVTDPAAVNSLILEALYDDGIKVWINGSPVLTANLADGELPFDAVSGPAREANDFQEFAINNPGVFLRSGENVIAVQLHNVSRDSSSDCFFDARLRAVTGPSGRGPTAGRLNTVFATNAPPAIRQVEHTPEQPAPGQAVRVTAKVTDPDGVASVTLLYQVVEPGLYVELTDPAYAENWVSMPMNDAGIGGDAEAADGVFTVEVPAELQLSRRLIRYRIVALDKVGAEVRVPYADDPQPNFAWFVYDAVPEWKGAVRPGAADTLGFGFTVSSNAMNRLPALHLISKKSEVEEATWLSRYGGDAYPWTGTLIYDGRVYDHVHFRARGGVWRYSMTKNMWKFDLNRGHDFEARDNWGRKFKTGWTKVNLGASIQQGDYNHRGEQGMFESVGLRLFQLAGVTAPHTSFVQFRVVDSPAEVEPSNQYEGDFWGVYLLVEQENGRFLEEHDLPDSNFYKMEGGTGELNNLGPLGPANKGDLNQLLSQYNNASDEWWQTNWNLPKYYSYQAIVQAIHHYDISDGKNYFYYHHPDTRQWEVMAWDLDLTWAHSMYRSDAGGAGVDAVCERLLRPGRLNGSGLQAGTGVMRLSGARPAIETAFRNRLREIRDLLWNEDEAWRLIDEYAGRLRGPTNAPSLLDADRAQWDYNPRMVNDGKSGQGRFYKWPNYSAATVSRDFNGALQIMRRYVTIRASYLDSLSEDPGRPERPTITYFGSTNFPVSRLALRCSSYAGSAPFARMRWRVAEVTKPVAPSWAATEPWHYEIDPVWQSLDESVFAAEMTVPLGVLKPGRTYRARVQFQDSDGRNSNWSAPLEFTAGEPDAVADLATHLRVTELMFAPSAGGDFEFIEVLNRSSDVVLDLAGVRFTQGIDYTFPTGATLAPGAYAVVVRTNAAAFRAHYGLAETVPVFGPFEGSFNNGGERVVLRTAAGGTDLADFTYQQGDGWPAAAAGAGHSFVVLPGGMEDQAAGSLNRAANWGASQSVGGSPGRPEAGPSLRLTVVGVAVDGAVTLRFRLPAGGACAVQRASDLSLGDWVSAYSVPPRAVEAELEVTVPTVPNSARSFFRLQQ